MKPISRRLILVLLSFALASCQGQKSEDREPLNEAYKKIDQGDDTGAISYLQELKTHDSRPEVRIALASAYAARAGVKVAKLWDFVQAASAPPVTEEQIKSNPMYAQNPDVAKLISFLASSPLAKDVETLTKVMTAFTIYQAKINTLPYVAREPRVDLDSGVSELKDVNTKGAHLYRAVLEMVILRSELKDGFDIWPEMQERFKKLNLSKVDAPENKQILCSLGLKEFTDWLGMLFDRVRATTKDVKIAYPSKSKELIGFDFAVQQYQRQLPNLRKSLVPESCE